MKLSAPALATAAMSSTLPIQVVPAAGDRRVYADHFRELRFKAFYLLEALCR